MAEVLSRALKRIKNIMKEKGISQKSLGELCDFSQAKASNILSGKGKIEFEDIELICKKLEIKFEDIVKENSNDLDFQESIEKQIDNNLKIVDSNFILDPENMAFNGYCGKYYVYLYPTKSSEADILKGTLQIEEDSEEHICRASLKIFTGKFSRDGKKIEKVFNGQAIISLPMSSVYCILISPQYAEINFLNFRHSFILNEELVCRLATLSTVSSEDSRRPCTLRVLITRDEIVDEKALEVVKSHLLQNQSDITISENAYDMLVQEGRISKEFQKVFNLLKKETTMYIIEESRLRSVMSNKIDALENLARLRNASEAMRYNKIGTKADEQVYQYINNSMQKKLENS